MKTRPLLPTLIFSAAWSLLPAMLAAQQISVADVVVAEGAGQAVFTLTLSQAVPTPVTVNYETTDGTAAAPEDYTTTSGVMTFPANVLTRTVSVPIINDSEGELDETFHLNLSNVSANATIATSSAVGTIGESDITALSWDPGSADFGTVVQTGSGTPVGRRYFKITTQTTLRGGWRTALQVTAGEAHLHASQGSLPTPGSAALASGRTGSDGWVVSNESFTAGDVWYVLVDVTTPATWRLYSGDVFVQNMGTLQYTDTNGNSAYTIGEPVLPSGSGPVVIGPEGMRFFSGAAPSGTPAWSLWLNGSNRDLAVRQGAVPFHDNGPRDHLQSGAILLVPDYIESGFTQFFSVEGNPGETVNLDSRIQSVTDITFGSTQANVNVTAAPFSVYRVQVPIDQIAWDVAVTAHSGNPNVCIRRDVVPYEWFNDAMSEVGGSATDSVTLVPPTLTNGTWFITVYGTGSHQFTLRNGIPVITPMNYVDTKVNDLTTRAGWRYYAVSNIPSQLGSLGWQLELAGQVPGTEIAIRRNAVPGRWNNHNGFGQSSYGGGWHVDNSRTTGLLQIPGHQADIWYVGIYWPSSPLGAFTLQASALSQTPVAFSGGSTSVSGQGAGDWRWFRIEVPAGVLGWDVRLRDVIGGSPQMWLRRDLLPDGTSWNWPSFHSDSTWPSGYAWGVGTDWTSRYTNADGSPAPLRFLAAMGRPLEPGTYYVGVRNTDAAQPTSYTLESRGIGAGQFYTVTNLGFAAGSSAAISGLQPREPRYFKVTVPANMRSWEITLDPTLGEMMLVVRRGYVPVIGADDGTQGGSLQTQVQKMGAERHVILPASYSGQDYLEAGDYYLAVVSEGQNPPDSYSTGSGAVSGTLTSRGPLVAADLGTASAVGVGEPVALLGGQLKAFRFSVPAGTSQLELRLNDRVGQPRMTLNNGLRLPGISYPTDYYGAEGGTWLESDDGTGLITIANPAPGDYSLMVYATFSGGHDETAVPASTTLLVQAVGPVPVAFNGGTAAVSDQGVGSWKYFRIEVPAGVLGWDVRLRDVIGGSPQMWLRRDLLPDGTSWNWPSFHSDSTWPSGYAWGVGTDWTSRYTNADGSPAPLRFLAAMGRPLEPGTYYVGVRNTDAAQPTSYTLESRGIGAGQFYTVTNLGFAAGSSAAISGLQPREPRYFKVTVPANMRSWEITLDPTLGEMMLVVRRGYVPVIGADDGTQGGSLQTQVQKMGAERHVILPASYSGQDYLEAGDYYLAVVSEGQNPPDSYSTGSGAVSGTLTSRGPLVAADLGTASAVGVGEPVALLGGQLKAFRFSVPAGTSQLELRLNDRVGQPRMTLNNGLRLPGISYPTDYYGAEGGTWLESDDGTGLITIANPAPGDYSLMVYATFSGGHDETAVPASTTLLVQAVGPVPVAFNGGTAAVSDQGVGSWKYFRIEVPAGVLGWDVRLRDVIGGSPQMWLRRDLLPDGTSWNWPSFHSDSTWPSGYAWGVGTDWTSRYTNADGSPAPLRFLAAMGRPLEPGTYYVGVRNTDAAQPTSYTLESRGIGAGQFYTVTNLGFAAGSSAAISGLQPREPRYFKVTVPANMRSWEITLDPTLGEMMLVVRRGYVPVIGADDGTQGGSLQTQVQKMGAERHVILPASYSGQDYLEAGDYYLAVVSEGQNPPDSYSTGSGAVSGTLTSRGPLVAADLGTASAVGVGEPVALLGGQLKAFRFSVPAGTSQLELRLNDRVGQPRMTLNNGLRLPGISYPTDYYGAEGGMWLESDNGTGLISVANPAPGDYSLMVYATFSGGHDEAADPASATLLARQKPHLPLNFDVALNGGGGSHTDSRQVFDGERTVYEVAIPANWEGQPLPGWMLNLEVTQGSASMRVFKNWPSTVITDVVTVSGRWGVIVPPWLTPGTTWHVEVLATGSTQYTLTSSVVPLARAPWVMPVGYNQTFGDTGLTPGGSPLPGDQGTDLGQGDWHFYAVDVPTGNGGLLRTELQAISGNPDLYIREDGVPTSSHGSDGSSGSALNHRSLTSTGTEYGNWVPLDGRSEHQLRTGRWYVGVKAEGSSNVRYRLKLSTGSVAGLSLNQSILTNQTIAAGDWRFYRFTVPEDAPMNWNLTFSQQIGDVVMDVRDTVPPGNGDSTSTISILNAAFDSKNQGPYEYYGYDAAGTHGFPLPPLRPGHTYYAGFRAVSDAVFSVSSATSGGTLGTLPGLDYYTGTINTSVPAGGSVLYRIHVPAGATRMKWSATHPSSVEMRLEQGTLPGTTGSQHWTSGSSENVSFNQSLTSSSWPWLANRNYYLRVMNSSGANQNVVLTMNGKNAATEDEDEDGLPDAWEDQYFGSTTHSGTSDPDGDGVTNAVELADGTLPNDVNSAKYFLTLSPYNGTATKAPDQPKYDRGTTVTLTNTPTGGHTFLGWQRVGSYADDFVVRITGTVTIPTDGNYTFGTSAADGLRLKINGITVISDDTTHSVSDLLGQITLTAGSYPLVLEAFEYSGGEALELFAAPGAHASFNSNFKLLGDTSNGGLVVQTPSGASTVPGLTVRQIIGVGTDNIYSLTRMDELLAGTRAKRAETTLIAQTINFIGSGSSEGRFSGNANFPLQQPEATNPIVMGMYGDYTVAAMNMLPLADAVDAPELSFTQAGEAPWLGGLSALAHDTVDHAVSGPITHSQSSSFSTTVVGPGTLTFRWKVSSEASNDPLQFLVNNSVNQQISGEQPYALVTYTVPAGAQILTWRYTKNATVTSGEDRGWVDQISYSPVRYSLTVNASGGTVNVSPQQADYAAGTVVTLTAAPTGDNTFLGWSGAVTGSTNPTTVTMDDNNTVTASFGLRLPAALDTQGRTFTQGGDGNWFGQTGITHDAVDAAQSGAVDHSQQTWFETTVTGPGNLSFWWKVSSESGFDYLEFYINGVLQTGGISGDVDWVQKSYTLGAGSHTLRWRYMKDNSDTSGSDAGWVDEVVWTSSPVPTVTAISPNTGSTEGGTSVTLTGTDFTGATSVTIGGAAATNISVVNSTTITCTTPARPAGSASVLVTTAGGTNAANTLYTYQLPIPVVNETFPDNGLPSGGNTVNIGGRNFTGASSVTFGGTAATNVSVLSDQIISCTAPAHAAGTVSVLVTTPNGTSAANSLYTYVIPIPTVSAISPNTGSTAGGAIVTITGTFFTGITGVTIGGVAATDVGLVSPTTLFCTAPAHAAGGASVVVTNIHGSNAANTLYTYVAPPTVTAVSPAIGSIAGGTSVTLTGTNFTGATGVTFGGTAATSVNVVNSTTITCITPAHAAGAVSVLVTTGGGTNANNALFTYEIPAPDIAVAQGGPLTDGIGSVSLGSVPVASSSGPLTFTITNPGTAELTDLEVTKDGPNADDFTVSDLSATSIPVGTGTVTFTVTFSPSGGGGRSAALHITSNVIGAKNPFDIGLSGSGRVAGKAAQTIVFTPPAKLNLSDSPFTLTASASSDLPVTFTLVSGPAILSEDELTLTAPGAVKVRASQAGDDSYLPATPVERTITVAANPTTLTMTNLSQTYTGTPRPITVLGTGGTVAVTYKVGANFVSEPPINFGSYAVKAVAGTTTKTGTLLINKAPLFVQPDDQRRLIGQPNPVLGFSYSGFLDDDNAANSVSKAPVIATTATAASAGGLYPITASGGTSANYYFIYLRGTMKVETFAASYEAMLVDAGTPQRPAAKLELTVVATCKTFSAKLTTPTETAVVSLPGTLTINPLTETATGTATVKKGANTYLVTVTLPLTGEFMAEAKLNGAVLGNATDGQKLLTLAKGQTLSYIGTHSALLAPATASVGVPAGAGWAVATIDSKGVIKLTGKLADGSSLTASLAADGGSNPGYRLFLLPYTPARTGAFIAGAFALKPHPDLAGRRIVAFEDDADLIWVKTRRDLDTSYRAGFGPVNTRFTLDPWLPPASAKTGVPAITLTQRLGLTANQFTAQHSAISSASFIDLPITLGLNATTNIVGVSAPLANLTKWKVTLTPATGAFAGSFELIDAGKKRAVPFAGMMRQPPSTDLSGLIGDGNFQLPALTPAPNNEILSGEVIFER